MLFAVISLEIYDKLHLKKGNDKRNGEICGVLQVVICWFDNMLEIKF